MSMQTLFARADTAEQRMCRIANRVCRQRTFRSLFRIVSRLGDGVFWYALIAAMPLLSTHSDPARGFLVSLQMTVAGVAGLMIYKVLKRSLVRERPFIGLVGVECAMPPLDRYSFPSGHTLHAVLLTSIVISHEPHLAIFLAPFALLVAMSRVVLGLHYPSDVLVGAFLGWLLARASGLVFAAAV